MKIKLSVFIVIIVINFSYGQKNPADSSGTSRKYNQYSRYEIFFETGYALPVGTFGKAYLANPNEDIKASLQKTIEGDSGGFNAQSTMAFECGITFFIHRKPLKNVFGIRTVLFSYSSFPFRWEGDSGIIINKATFNSVRLISMRTGPVMRIYSKNNLQFDFFYQVGIAFGSHGGWDYADKYDEFYNGYKYNINDNAEFKMNGGFGIMHEVGAALSFHYLKAGISFNFGSLKYNNAEFSRTTGITMYGYNSFGTLTSQGYSLFADDKLAVNAPVSYLKFYLALRFGE